MPTVYPLPSEYRDTLAPGRKLTVTVPTGGTAIVRRIGVPGGKSPIKGPATQVFGPYLEQQKYGVTAFAVECTAEESLADQTGSTGNIVPVNESRDAIASDHGATLVFSGAYTITIQPASVVAYPHGFGFAVRPPDSGNASIAIVSPGTLNGAGATVTRALAGNILCAVAQIGPDAYAVTGS